MTIREYLEEVNPQALVADGFDKAMIGTAFRDGNIVALYDLEKCTEVLIERDGMTFEEAIEYIDYNVLGSYMGMNTPIFANIDIFDEFKKE